jgi:hypothetical protein
MDSFALCAWFSMEKGCVGGDTGRMLSKLSIAPGSPVPNAYKENLVERRTRLDG